MLALKYLLLAGAIGMFIAALAIVAYDLYVELQHRRGLTRGVTGYPEPEPLRWRTAVALVAVAWAPLLIALSIVVVPSGMAGVRVSQVIGTRPGTLYPGVHLVKPFIERVVLFDMRDHLFTTGVSSEVAKTMDKKKPEPLNVQAKEGLTLGLAITVRYRLDPNRLDYIQSNLPQPVENEIVPPVVASALRELVPNYTVRDVFAAKREEVRQRADEIITQKLGADGIRVKEVMLRDIQLPPEYAKGLERSAAEGTGERPDGRRNRDPAKAGAHRRTPGGSGKGAQVKDAEGEAQVRVLQAKGESDAMQYTLPLKQKQIEQTRLEAEARKEATIKNAEAAGASQGDRQQGGTGAPQPAGGRRGQSHPRDRRRRRRAHEVGGAGAQAESAADQQDHRRAALRQGPDHDGALRRKVLLRQRRVPQHGRAAAVWRRRRSSAARETGAVVRTSLTVYSDEVDELGSNRPSTVDPSAASNHNRSTETMHHREL